MMLRVFQKLAPSMTNPTSVGNEPTRIGRSPGAVDTTNRARNRGNANGIPAIADRAAAGRMAFPTQTERNNERDS